MLGQIQPYRLSFLLAAMKHIYKIQQFWPILFVSMVSTEMGDHTAARGKKQYDIRTWKADEQLSFPKHYTNHRVPQILGGLVSVRRHAIHDGLTNTTKGSIVGVNNRLLFTARCYVTVTNVHVTELTAVNIHTT